MHLVETYLRDMADIRRSGAAVPETSYYPALDKLLDAIGADLRPKVYCIINPANRGAGIPDGGLFSADQLGRGDPADWPAGQDPSRGVIEAKAPADDVEAVAAFAQVDKYFTRYRLVLVTNFRDFLLVGKDTAGNKTNLEQFTLAADEAAFWSMAAHPRKPAAEKGDALIDYLRRVLIHTAEVAAPEALAWILAAYAKQALAKIEATDLPALNALRLAMEEALGITFEGQKGEHFFRSTLVQTLFYGLFSAWVVWAKGVPPEDRYAKFDWKGAGWNIHVPMISSLFHQVADPTKLRPLGLVKILDWTTAVLNRVNRAEFFARFAEDHAVQYFYEPFLEAFDPDLRKALGVWYTPPEIVRYMVERVDRVLRTELGVADGLADPQVYVLDPCCGTGAYLVEVLDRIARTLADKGDDALLAQDLKQAAVSRVFGFEILPAPYVISHLQLGLVLNRFGATMRIEPPERAAVYLTNALTGWEPPDPAKEQLVLPMPELQAERDAAERVKRDTPILVILGNPPYNAFAGISPREEGGLVDVYKDGLNTTWGIKKFNLDDLYVRFFRLAERRIAEMTGRGVVCFISNYSYLGDPSFVVMRKRLLERFDAFWFDCMNGDSRATGKLTPDGKPDPSVFSTPHNPEGIRVGTAIGLMVKANRPGGAGGVRFRHFWGTAKNQDLLTSLAAPDLDATYQPAVPTPDNRYSFRPMDVAAHYLEWPKLTDLCATPPSNGLMEKRGGALIDIDRAALGARMRSYYDRSVSWDHLKRLVPGLTDDAARFDAKAARQKVLASETWDPTNLVPYAARPFDSQWAYYSGTRPLWNEPRPTLWKQCWQGNTFLLSRVATSKKPEGAPISFSRVLFDDHYLSPDASGFPMRLCVPAATNGDQHALLAGEVEERRVANLSPSAQAYLAALGFTDPDVGDVPELVWMHALAIGYSPAYLTENADGIRSDWPRIPLPGDRDRLLASAALGRSLAALLDPDTPVPGVTAGTLDQAFKSIAGIAAADGGQLDKEAGDFDLTVGWGHAGKGSVTMPGRGRLIERDYTAEERAAIVATAEAMGLSLEDALARLGDKTCDVYLNDRAHWRNVPTAVWDFFIGGYQVIKKWLSYREKSLLGRGLTTEEVRHVQQTARRLAAIRLLEPTLDANYAVVKVRSFSVHAV